jgi:ssDNA-binding Zn-finger/Zn-ribbon topoisomerase 1
MKYQCPKCNEIISDRALRSVPGQHRKSGKKSGLLYFQACPKCGKESYHYNADGEKDGGSWIELTNSGELYDFMKEPVPYRCFVPTTLAECDNTGCLECTFEGAKGDLDRYECPYRLQLTSGRKNPGLEAFGVV